MIGNCRRPQIAGADQHDAGADQPQRLLLRRTADVPQQQAGKHAEQAGADRRQRAQQPFRIARARPTACRAGSARRSSWRDWRPGRTSRRRCREPARRSSTPSSRRAARPRRRPARARSKFRNSSEANKVAKRDALQHAEKADVGPVLADAAVVDQPQAVEQQRPAQHARYAPWRLPSRSTRRGSDSTIDTPVTKMNSGKMKS